MRSICQCMNGQYIYIHTHGLQGFPGGSAGKESACNAGDLRSIPGLGRSPGEGKGYPLQFGLQNSMDCIVHGVAKSQTGLSDSHVHLVHCRWECKLVQPLWKTVWRFLKIFKIELPYDPAIPLLSISQRS